MAADTTYIVKGASRESKEALTLDPVGDVRLEYVSVDLAATFEIKSPQSQAIKSIFTRPTASGKTLQCLFGNECGSRLVNGCKGEGEISVSMY